MSNEGMRTGESPIDPLRIWRECISRRAGVCDVSVDGCVRCGPIEQGLRAATWVECQWPRYVTRKFLNCQGSESMSVLKSSERPLMGDQSP